MRTNISKMFGEAIGRVLSKAEFQEGEHPRGKGGKFVPAGEGKPPEQGEPPEKPPEPESPEPQKVAEGLDRRFLHVEVESPDVVNPHISLEYSVPRTIEVPGKGRMQQGSNDANLSGKIDRDKKRVVLTKLYVSKPLGRKGIGTALVLEAARRSPAGYEVTTSGMLSEGGRALFESMAARGLAIKTDVGNYIVNPVNLSKEGTSEGAKRGWETRRGGSPEMPKVGERVRVGSGSYTVESFDTDDTFPPAIASYEVKSGYLFYHGRDGSEGVVSGSKKEAKKWMEDVDREVKERPHETPRPWQESDGGGENMRRAEESAKKAADTFGLAPSKVEFGVTTGFSAVAGEHSGDTVHLINAHKPDLASLSFDTKVTVGEHAAAHEVAHRVFSGDPESGRKAMEEMGQVKKPVSMYHAIAGDFEGLMDAAAAYIHSPEDLKAFSPETFAAVEAWAKRSRGKHSE